MAKRTLNCTKNGWVDLNHPSTNYSSGETAKGFTWMFLGFEAVSGIPYRPITGLTYYQFIRPSYKPFGTYVEGACAVVTALTKEWDEKTVTYNNWPSGGNRLGNTNYMTSDEGGYVQHTTTDIQRIKEVLKYGLMSDPDSVYSARAAAETYFTTRYASSNKPYLVLEYGTSNSTGSSSGTPTTGFINPAAANTFKFTYTPPTDTLETPTKTGVRIQYKTSSDGKVAEINCGNVSSYTVPANTFSTGTLYWRAVITTTAGEATSAWYQLSTTEPYMTSWPISPKGTVEDGSAPITFTWNYSSSVGSLATRSFLQWSTDGATWNALGLVYGSGKAYTAPANKFTAGTIYWRTAVGNASGVMGVPSAPVKFTVVAAPQAPSVTVDGAPFTTVEWVSKGQKAYQVFIDGVGQGVQFGTATTYTLQNYLEDGEHTIGVATLGEFGLWSEQGIAAFTVENVPGDDVFLSGAFGIDATLEWGTEGLTPDYIVYRDGVKIGAVSGTAFTDRLVLGNHEWYVVNVLPGGYYTKSNVVQGALKSCETVIDTLQNPTGWQTLRLSANSDTSQRFSYSKTYSLRHFKGAALPLLEQSSFEDGSGSYDVSFATVQEAQAFEAFKGKVCIIKSRGGNVVIGALNNLEKVAGDFFISYTFTVQRIYWEDFIDGQNS